MDKVRGVAAKNGTAQGMPSAPDAVITGGATTGNAAARTAVAVACLVAVAVGIFAAGHIRFTLDPPATKRQALQDPPIGIPAASPNRHAPMVGPLLTGEQAARAATTALDGAAAACGSCDARHRNLGRLGESTAP